VDPATADGSHALKRQNNRHALGFSGGIGPGSGFSYRHYLGDTMLQGTLFTMITEKGDSATVWGGLSFAHYLLVWHDAKSGGWMPSTSGLRVVGGGSYLFNKSISGEKETPIDPNCIPDPKVGKVCQIKEEPQTSTYHLAAGGLGIGFEFGAIMRPGFSFTVDLMLTAIMLKDGNAKWKLDRVWPLPSVALMYSW